MNSQYVNVNNPSDHNFASFLRSFGEWEYFSFSGVTFFQTTKGQKPLAIATYDNQKCLKSVSIHKNCVENIGLIFGK